MHRSRTYRVLAFALSGLLLFSSFSWTLDAHFCRGQFKGVSLFGTLDCHAQSATGAAFCCVRPVKSEPSCCTARSAVDCSLADTLREPDCCSNEVQIAKADLLLPAPSDAEPTNAFAGLPAVVPFLVTLDRAEVQPALPPRAPPPPPRRLFQRLETYRL